MMYRAYKLSKIFKSQKMPHKTYDFYEFTASFDKVKSLNIPIEFLSFFLPLHYLILTPKCRYNPDLHFYIWDNSY